MAHVDDRGHGDALRVVGMRERRRRCSRGSSAPGRRAGIQVERPTARRGRCAEPDGDRVLQTQQPPDDDRPVRPQAGPARRSAGNGRPRPGSRHAVGGDAGGDVVGVAVELAAGRRNPMPPRVTRGRTGSASSSRATALTTSETRRGLSVGVAALAQLGLHGAFESRVIMSSTIPCSSSGLCLCSGGRPPRERVRVQARRRVDQLEAQRL